MSAWFLRLMTDGPSTCMSALPSTNILTPFPTVSIQRPPMYIEPFLSIMVYPSPTILLTCVPFASTSKKVP